MTHRAAITAAALNELFELATAAEADFAALVHSAAMAALAQPIVAPTKSRERAAQKVAADYAGDVSRLTDVLRGTVVVRHRADFELVIAQLAPVTTKAKDRRCGTTRDVLLVVDVRGVPAEVQVHVPAVLAVKGLAHHLYEVERTTDRSWLRALCAAGSAALFTCAWYAQALMERL